MLSRLKVTIHISLSRLKVTIHVSLPRLKVTIHVLLPRLKVTIHVLLPRMNNDNNNSYTAVYPVQIYKLAALYIINIKIRLTIKKIFFKAVL